MAVPQLRKTPPPTPPLSQHGYFYIMGHYMYHSLLIMGCFMYHSLLLLFILGAEFILGVLVNLSHPFCFMMSLPSMFKRIATWGWEKCGAMCGSMRTISWAAAILVLTWFGLYIIHVIIQNCPLSLFLQSGFEYLVGSGTTTGLLVGVLSSRDHFLQRLAARNTWAVQLKKQKIPGHLVFVVGDTDCDIHPDLRISPHTCQEKSIPSNYRHGAMWLSSRPVSDAWERSHDGLCVVSVGLRALQDVMLRHITINLSGITSSKKGNGGERNVIPQPTVTLSYGETVSEKIDFKGSSDADSAYWKAGNVNWHLPDGFDGEFIVELDQEDCFKLKENRSCLWGDGDGAVQYTFVRYNDGIVEPWTTRHCPPFILHLQTGVSRCPKGWTLFNSHCYHAITHVFHSWYDAKEGCEEVGASLATITNQEENDFVKGLVTQGLQGFFYDVWLGLHAETAGEEFVWSDGSTEAYRNWDVSEPNHRYGENCVELLVSRGARWNDLSCSAPNRALCKMNNLLEGSGGGSDAAAVAALQSAWRRHTDSVTERLEEEQRHFGDLLVVSGLTDTYDGLPTKTKALVQWSSSAHPGLWLLKSDDDTYVNVTAVVDVIVGTRGGEHAMVGSERATGTYSLFGWGATGGNKGKETSSSDGKEATFNANSNAGDESSSSTGTEGSLNPTTGEECSVSSASIHAGPAVFSEVQRRRAVPRHGKHAEYEFTGLTYTAFPSGAAYLLTGDVVAGLADVSSSLRSYGGEDVSVGVWLSSLTFPHHHCSNNRLHNKKQLTTPTLWTANTIMDVGHSVGRILVAVSSLLCTVCEQVFLGKSSTSSLTRGPVLPETLSWSPQCSSPARLVNVPCWLRSEHCHSFVVAADVTLDQMDQIYRNNTR